MPESKLNTQPSPIKIILIVLTILIIIALAALVIIQQLKLKSNSIENNRTAVPSVIQERVAKLMLLPNEEALVSEIQDAESIKAQPFFSQVENGDQVLIFAQAAKIIIYRPSQNLIINVGPIVDDRVQSQLDNAPSDIDYNQDINHNASPAAQN